MANALFLIIRTENVCTIQHKKDFDVDMLLQADKVFWDRAGWIREMPKSHIKNLRQIINNGEQSPNPQAGPQLVHATLAWEQTTEVPECVETGVKFMDTA